VPKKFIVFAGLTGGLNPNTYRTINTINPFATELALRNTIHKIEIYGGVKGEISPQTSFYLSSSSTSIENLVTFATIDDNAAQVILYDNGNAKRTSLAAGIQHHAGDKFRLGFHTQFHSYSTSTLAKAFSLPLLESKLNMGYNIGDKFLVKLDLFYWGERNGAMITENVDFSRTITPQKLDPFVDLNFGVDYRYSKNFSAFIQINNIANGRYQRFVNYPVYGINIMGGFTFTF